jgi:hypothetical protein
VGVASVQVTTPSGTSAITAGSQFTYGAAGPVITALNPSSGPLTGGTTVLITGTGLTGSTSVKFGSIAASFAVNNDMQITAVSPASGAAGIATVQVSGPAGVSPVNAASQFTYGVGGPLIGSLSPASGPVAGGNSVTITGSGFSGTTSVTFGLVPAVFAVNSDAQIVAIAPAAPSAGTVNVQVTTPIAVSASTAASQYTYGAVGPVITSISPSSGPTAGGTSVTITGTGFTGASQVAFGSNGALFTVISDTQINGTSPTSASPGTVDVSVRTPAGTSAVTASDRFTYVGSGPAITGVNPQSGPTTGGTVVVITGSGFTGATAVTFGGASANFTVNGDTQITATAPPHGSGTVDITVSAPSGTSPNTSADNFSYVIVGPQLCPEIPLWVNDLAYGSIGGGFWWDPVSGQVWTGQRGWHPFDPQPPRPNPQPLWVNAVAYGSRGEGFWWDPVSGQVWTGERGWHVYSPQGCIPR